MTASANFQKKTYTEEEYLELEERSQGKHEYYNGKIIKIAGGTPIHNEIAVNVMTAIKIALRQTGSKKYKVSNSDINSNFNT